MIYDCIFYNKKFVTAKLFGHKWSDREKNSPFEIITQFIEPETEDRELTFDVGGVDVKVSASVIHPSLICIENE